MKRRKPIKPPEKVEIHIHVHPVETPKPLIPPELDPGLVYMVPRQPIFFPKNFPPVFTLPSVTCLGI